MYKLISATCGKHIQILDTQTDIRITRISVSALISSHVHSKLKIVPPTHCIDRYRIVLLLYGSFFFLCVKRFSSFDRMVQWRYISLLARDFMKWQNCL